MRFGIFALPTYFVESDGTLAAFYQHILALLTQAEALGFDSAWVNEHHFHAYGGMIPSPPVLLAALARRTSRIRLGTSVSLLPLHSPLESAEAYAMVDQLSGGRLELGVGRGFMSYDYDTFGVPFDEGYARVHESLEVVLKAWREQPFSHHGRFFDYDNVSVWPTPLQRPHPPIWGAATRSPDTFRWIGSHGYGLLTVIYLYTLDELNGLIDIYREAAAAAGLARADQQVATHYQVYCSENPAEARRVGQLAIARYVAQNNAARSQGAVPFDMTPEGIDIDRLIAENRVCIGTPDECATILERAGAVLGLTSVDCTFYFGGIDYAKAERSLELFAREVMPRFRTQPVSA
ncbi:MAG TPA: LLM class flavin-dependent oxidoreductase [Chloroflexota bacterium]|jgi:natural product biosynthesis luciferase-like monooxygenase protein